MKNHVPVDRGEVDRDGLVAVAARAEGRAETLRRPGRPQRLPLRPRRGGEPGLLAQADRDAARVRRCSALVVREALLRVREPSCRCPALKTPLSRSVMRKNEHL